MGYPPLPLEMMLRIHCLQQWLTLFDQLMAEMPIDTPCFGRFVEIGMIEDRIPEETTTLNFRHLPEAHQIAVQNLASINQSLSERVWCSRSGR